jgi:dTDP-4-dehydrorhamnose reductase
MPRRLLITGAGGMLGQDVTSAARDAGLHVLAFTRRELDVTDASAVDRAMLREKPDVVINCAAWTDVDGAEASYAAAVKVNGEGAGNVARGADVVGAWTIHISSDYVFDGAKREPYVESDPTGPLSGYGRSKLAGELEVQRAAPDRHTIVRSSWLFGPGGACFPATMLRLGSERDELRVVDDQVGSPTFTGHLAQALVRLATSAPPRGVVHLAGGGSCSWFELASELIRLAGLDCEVKPCGTAEMPRPAPRPAYSVLRSERYPPGLALPDWHEGVEHYLALGVTAR